VCPQARIKILISDLQTLLARGTTPRPNPSPRPPPVITALAGAYKAYTEAAQGEQAAPIIKAGVERHGNGAALGRVLAGIAARAPAFAGQLPRRPTTLRAPLPPGEPRRASAPLTVSLRHVAPVAILPEQKSLPT
jgi:hypothetical protein